MSNNKLKELEEKGNYPAIFGLKVNLFDNTPDQSLHAGLFRCVNSQRFRLHYEHVLCWAQLCLRCSTFLANSVILVLIFFMFIDHYGSVIRQQINSLGLNVTVAWLGSELEHIIRGVGSQPFLVLNWEPNTVSRAKQMTRISFPPCRCAKIFVVWSRYFMCIVDSWGLEQWNKFKRSNSLEESRNLYSNTRKGTFRACFCK